MPPSPPSKARVRIDGKFFRLAGKKFHVKGVTYGPFAPNAQGEFFAPRDQVIRDFQLISELGANVLRLYYVPPKWFLDLAFEHGLRVLVDVPWNKHLCFLDAAETRDEAVSAVRAAAESCARHPAVFALSVVNEIPPDIVRWSSPKAITHFIQELVDAVKSIDPDCLCTFGNYPPTEYLKAQNVDFFCYNVYLHHPKPFENYLSRLQMIADSKPLILGEFGIDSLREGEETKCEILAWQIELCYRGGLAGAIVYSFTDDWYKEGAQVTDWAFGLTQQDRSPKKSYYVTQRQFFRAPYFPLSATPKVSVVVASYNGERTLAACLSSLEALNYEQYEVLLVDDGSTDRTHEICRGFKKIHYIRHEKNLGLSTARNTGINAASGEIVAFTDSDCRADEDWLYFLIGDLLNSEFTGIGGHNLLPPEDSWVAAAVMVSPGGPAHVMLTDRLAEHIPGCNMAFYKWALEEIGGFDPAFRKAGDDVDVCWRLQQNGYRLGFSPAGFVWHYRRATARDYLKQQYGYGEAEALLERRHPEYFNWFGGSQWQGRIYSPARIGVTMGGPIIYHGSFATGFFQTLYSPPPSLTLMLVNSIEYHVFVLLPLIIFAIVFRPLLPTAIGAVLLPIFVSALAATQADLPRERCRLWSRPLVALLFFLQPIVRGWARHQGSFRAPSSRLARRENLRTAVRDTGQQEFFLLDYWNDKRLDRVEFLRLIIERLDQQGWQHKVDAGWNKYDVQIYGSAWSLVQLVTVGEVLGHGKQILRARLAPGTTLFAKAIICSILGAELTLIGFLGRQVWWPYLILLTLPLFVWFLAKDQRDLQRLIAVFIDELASEVKLKKIEEK
ncbi:MAG TPA: glycosyltransferase [Verrucomicrobiae bacterium]|nr:glycosyltransferase [Verrucomicrobiae bacterium]